jgi:hypothetical protein
MRVCKRRWKTGCLRGKNDTVSKNDPGRAYSTKECVRLMRELLEVGLGLLRPVSDHL